LGFVQKFGIGRAMSGMQSISDVLASRLRELGGEMLVNEPVAEIISSNKKVSGIRLKSGKIIHAAAVVATIYSKQAFELVSEGQIDHKSLT
jgi:phytoene dehydrogenase-like protein